MTDYNIIGNNYNHTRKVDPFIAQQLWDLLLPQKDLNYLDVGCGTGNYTIALHEKGILIEGLEPSVNMLSIAQAKNDKVKWVVGEAENMPYENNSFSGTIATLTIHHWQDLSKGFSEIYCTLQPGGNLVIFTATPEQMQGYWLLHYFPFMMNRSINKMPALSTIKQAAILAGLELILEAPYFIQDDLQDLFLYSGKNDPSLYLNDAMRKNISSFAALADDRELTAGLKALAADIQSGNFEQIKKSYANDLGDYLFLKFRKPE